MDFQQYQKMFPSPQEIQHQMQQQQRQHPQEQQHGFTLMDFCPPEFRQQYQQQQEQQQQQHQMMMMNAMFNHGHGFPMPNPFSMNFNNFMGGQNIQQQHQNLQHQRKNNGFHLPPPPVGFPSMPMPSTPSTFGQTSMMPTPSPLSNSSDGSTKSETPREIFFKTLSQSLKDANKFYCGKQITWKNPFLYKTYLCENYGNRSYCRFGVNCWYAHGPHELRCIPESDDLPDQAFITQYLSFLGLPKNVLDQLIQNAYYVANFTSEKPWFNSSKKSMEFPSFCNSAFSRSISLPNSPIKNDVIPDPVIAISKPMKDKFYSSYVPNDEWNQIQSDVNENSNAYKKSENVESESENPFEKSFHLFGNSFNIHQPYYFN